MAFKHATVTSTTTAQTVSLTGAGKRVVVTNLDGAGKVYFRLDGTTAVQAADGCQAVAAAAGASAELVAGQGVDGVSVSVISSASCAVHVELID